MTKQNGNDLLIPSIEDIDMIVFDVDGTLMDRDGMPPGMVGLMKETESRGVTISLASGRTLPNLTPIHQALGLSGFIIAENGGVLWDGPKGQKIELRANGDRCREFIEWIATQMPEIDPSGIESNRWRETEWCISGPHDIHAIRELLESSIWSDLRVVGTGFAIHVTERGINKKTALEIMLPRRNINPKRVLSCGDGLNDVPMFELTGHSIAVDDKYERVRSTAMSLTTRMGPRGVIEILTRLNEQ